MSEVRTRLLQAARELFVGQGFAKTTIQQLADAVGISKGAVYLQFRSKSEVMVALLTELEKDMLAATAALAERADLEPLEKLRAQLHYLFVDVREQRVLYEVYLKDAGVAIDEELALLAQRMRVDWQQMQEDFLCAAFPGHDRRFTTDLAVTLNGALNEYYSYVVLEGLDVDPDRVADFLVVMVEALVQRLDEGTTEPVLSAAALPDRDELEARIEAASKRRIETALDELAALAENLEPDDAAEVEETLAALHRALQTAEPSRVVLQGLLANLREHKELQPQRRALAHELRLKLI